MDSFIGSMGRRVHGSACGEPRLQGLFTAYLRLSHRNRGSEKESERSVPSFTSKQMTRRFSFTFLFLAAVPLQ